MEPQASFDSESIIREAERREIEYEWLAASEFYKRALGFLSERGAETQSDLHERLGYAFLRASTQAVDTTELRRLTQLAASSNEKANELLDTHHRGKQFRSSAMISCAIFWAASDLVEKKRHLEDSWRLAKEAMKVFDMEEDGVEYWKTWDQLTMNIPTASRYESDWSKIEEIRLQELGYAERSIKLFSNTVDTTQRARAYVILSSCLEGLSFWVSDPDKQERLRNEAQAYWTKGKSPFGRGVLIRTVSLGT